MHFYTSQVVKWGNFIQANAQKNKNLYKPMVGLYKNFMLAILCHGGMRGVLCRQLCGEQHRHSNVRDGDNLWCMSNLWSFVGRAWERYGKMDFAKTILFHREEGMGDIRQWEVRGKGACDVYCRSMMHHHIRHRRYNRVGQGHRLA